nr:unnamed protein product [Digitaria exilis]
MARRLPQGQARAVIPSTRNPEFTLAELRERTQIPVTKIVVDGSLSRSQLHGHCNRIIKKARKEAKQFVWNKPVLPQENSPASIDLVMGDVDSEIVKLCFEMKSLYCRGVLVREHFYELRTSGDPVSFVEGNIPLGYKESYDKMLQSTNPKVDLRPEDFLIAYQRFLTLRHDDTVINVNVMMHQTMTIPPKQAR